MNNADLIFTNALVLTMDEEFHQYDPGAVAVLGEKILAVGSVSEIKSLYSAPEVIDCQGKILMPGLINAHTHVPMSLMRGLADDLRLDVWLMGYMMPVEREFVSPEFVKLGTMLSCAEMIRGGTTCFADMFYYEESVAEGAAEAGMRAICGESVLKFPTPDAASYEEGLARAAAFIKKWKGHPLIIPSVAPHAPYTTTPEILKACASLAVEHDVPLQIHLAETAQEVEGLRNEHGMPVIPWIKRQDLFNAKVVGAHCVHVDDGEMRQMAHANCGAVHNPSSNLKLASGAAPIKRMLDLNVRVGLGTDGPASNNDLDMFEEIRLTSFLAKLQTGDPTAVPARTAVWMATRGSARALHIDHMTGSLFPGKKADMILVDISPIHNTPRFMRHSSSAYAQLTYATKATDVTDVMVNGKWLMRDRKLETLDERTLIQKSQEYAKRIDAFLSEREKSVLSKLIAIGGAMEEESFEIQVKVRVAETKPIVEAIRKAGLSIERYRHYREFDTYFSFDDPTQGKMRFREDEFVDEAGNVAQVRGRLTLIGQVREAGFHQEILLSRSRYFAPATNSLRFYREYFKPRHELEINKDRHRYLVRFKDVEFFINIDTVSKPDLGNFVEIKSRTWSRQDAEQKTVLAQELLALLGCAGLETVTKDYIELVEKR